MKKLFNVFLCSALSVGLFAAAVKEDKSLHNAATEGNVENIKKLLGLGFKKNLQDEHGDTPLHLAIKYNQADAAISLILAGTNLDIRNRDGLTATQLLFDKSELMQKVAISEGGKLMQSYALLKVRKHKSRNEHREKHNTCSAANKESNIFFTLWAKARTLELADLGLSLASCKESPGFISEVRDLMALISNLKQQLAELNCKIKKLKKRGKELQEAENEYMELEMRLKEYEDLYKKIGEIFAKSFAVNHATVDEAMRAYFCKLA